MKSVSIIRNLAHLGCEINYVFNKYGHQRALNMCQPLLIEYYNNMNYDWREWDYKPTKDNYVPKMKTQVPINHIIPEPGTPLGYRYRSTGDNKYPFDMFIITWQSGNTSPIHYHSVFGCSFIVLQGELMENLYIQEPKNNKFKNNGWRIHSQGMVSYIDNNIGAHSISNNLSTPAVSLHIYSPIESQVMNNKCIEIDKID